MKLSLLSTYKRLEQINYPLDSYFKKGGLKPSFLLLNSRFFFSFLLQLQQLGLPFGFRTHIIWWQGYLAHNYHKLYADPEHQG